MTIDSILLRQSWWISSDNYLRFALRSSWSVCCVFLNYSASYSSLANSSSLASLNFEIWISWLAWISLSWDSAKSFDRELRRLDSACSVRSLAWRSAILSFSLSLSISRMASWTSMVFLKRSFLRWIDFLSISALRSARVARSSPF